ncbi:MAG: TRAP transporter large permease [Spirochaetaceae bacterium]|jgi:tripartite ATP-independent transporter DctM subunit|nr:TRAP transporter large permease [Spirochaetaceae bacterium]
MSSGIIFAAAAVMLLLLFLKIPVFVSVLAGSVTYFILSPGIPAQIMAQRVIAGIESIPLLAIPFFVCSGVIMNYSGVTIRIMRFCEVLMRKVPGGLAQVNVLLSTLMGGLSGSNLADAAMEAKMLVPEMEKRGFSREFSSVVTAVSAMITPLIPPGIAMIIYGSIANVSIGRLFVAGIGPGLLLCVAMMILVGIISLRRRYTNEMTEHVSLKKAFLEAVFPLLLPIIIIGGIRLGVFTPTEAGAVAIVYAVALSIIYKEFSFSNIFQALKETVATTASIMMIVGAASAFAWILTREQIPQRLTSFIITSVSNKYVFLLIINVFLLVVGMFIEGNAGMIVLVPLLVPVARAFGINDIQFAMIFIFNNAIGAISPPMGTLMFVTCGITKCKVAAFIREAVPFYILLLVCLLLLTFVPFFSQALVNLVY